MQFPEFYPVQFSIGPLDIRWYALAYVAGIVLGWWYANRLARNNAVWQPGKPLTSGYIALQSEGQPVDFRKAELLNLEGCTDPKATNYRSYFIKSNPAACRYAAAGR